MTEQLTFTTKSGLEVPLRRVAQRHVARIIGQHPIPEPPVYQFKDAGGSEVVKPHDQTTLETPEDHKAWNDYIRAKARALEEQNLAIARFLMYQCVAQEPPPAEEWSIDFGLWGLDRPDPSDAIAYKVEWIESEVLSDPADYSAFMARLYQLGGLLKEDQAEEFEKFFRITLERLAAA